MMSPPEATADSAGTRRVPALGVALLAVGALLLAAAVAYYAYGFFATRDLGDLTVTVPDPSETMPTMPDTMHEGPSPASQELYPGSLMPAASGPTRAARYLSACLTWTDSSP